MAAKKQRKPTVKQLQDEVRTLRELREGDAIFHQRKIEELNRKLADTEDKMLPQKQLLLKELAYLVNATSRAVRTTMWSMTPGVVRRP